MKKKLELLKTSDNQKTLKAYREKNKKKHVLQTEEQKQGREQASCLEQGKTEDSGAISL